MGMESIRDTKDDSLFPSIQDTLTPFLRFAYGLPENVEMNLLRDYEAMDLLNLKWQQFGKIVLSFAARS